MAWITIPNEVALGFTGKPIRSQKMNDNLDLIFKPIKCPSEDCEFSSTILTEWQDHRISEHSEEPDVDMRLEPELEDRSAAWIVMEILLAFNRQDNPQRPNILRRVQKGNDSHHSTELWRRAWNCRERPEIKVKKEQYDWLHQFLDRKVPLAADAKEVKERRDQGEEQQSVGSHLFGLSEDVVRQALTTLPDRRIVEPEEKELEPQEEVK